MNEALNNIGFVYNFQFFLRGALFCRLATVTLYYTLYGFHRLCRISQEDSRLRVLHLLSVIGLDERTVMLCVPHSLEIETDLISSIFLLREHFEEHTYEQIEGFEPQLGQTVIDVGAHHGFFSLIAANKVGTAGKVIAIEADPKNSTLLARNVNRNKLWNIRPFFAAALNRTGMVKLYRSKSGSGNHSLMNTSEDVIDVPCWTLDSIAEECHLEKVDLLKIDVEGAGLIVLDGAHKILYSHPKIVMEVEGGHDQEVLIHSALMEQGYTIQWKGNMLYAR